ncbi:MAG TPA: DUF4956 domain-containing protein [Longimicrobiaceae bacterium]|nr:DUF4956 domain-containing protein [Longimicrobiaceae bacterium]
MQNDRNEQRPESETLLTGTTRPEDEPRDAGRDGKGEPPRPAAPPAPALPPAPKRRRGASRWRRLDAFRQLPLLLLLVYYALLIAVDAALVTLVPTVRRAFVQPDIAPDGGAEGVDVLTSVSVRGIGDTLLPTLNATVDRALITLLVILGALSLVVPVAWIYMRVKRFRYDPALVRSVIILPVVVAGIAMVVKNSIALAFSLAGIVAAVRFRNTLKDPRDAVYVFLAIGIGLSAGVQALDVALMMSLVFNVVVLVLWRYNVGSIYSGSYARTGILSVGDGNLLVAQSPDAQRQIRRRLLDDADQLRSDGILLVHSPDPTLARQTVQEALGDMASDWMLSDIVARDREISTLEYVIRLKKKVMPVDLVGALDERWSTQLAAAEYIPFRIRRRKRGKKGKKGKKKNKDKKEGSQ